MKNEKHTSSMKQTKYWEYILKKYDEINSERIKFNKDFSSMLSSNTDEMAITIKCHLIIENYINQYLKVAFPSINNIKEMNLRFINKIEMINNSKTIFSTYYKSLKQINSLRNKFAHNLQYIIIANDLKELNIVMDAWNDAGGCARTNGVELIKQYTMFFCSSVYNIINIINKEIKELGICGYIKWLEEMVNTKT